MQMSLADVADDVLDVTLTGRLDTPGVDEVESQLLAAVNARNGHTTIDLARVDFVGSMAIRMFMAVGRAAAKRGRQLVLYAPQPLVSQLFDTVSLRDIIPVEADRDTALRVART
jgi:anti-anti-sigma factor